MKNARELLDHRSIMIAVKKGVVPREEFRNALREQRHLLAKNKPQPLLSEILIERGVITESQVSAAMIPALKADQTEVKSGQAPSTDPVAQESVESSLPEGASTISDNNSTQCPPDGLPQKSLSLIITKDGFAAYISVQGTESDFPTVTDVHRVLSNKNVIFGIIDDLEIKNRLKEALEEKSSFQVAAGFPPQNGQPDKVDYHFDTNPFRVGTVKEDGLMDWKERGEYPFVEKDTVLATVTPGKKGVPGKDIFGTTLPAIEGPRLHLFAGKGVAKSKDRLQLVAKASGQPQLAGRGNVSVIQTLEIKGDIGIETGHVDFEGHVEVKGAVEKGYRVKCDSLRAKEILSDQVEVSGDVVAMRGIFGAHIKCGGRIKANHVNKSTIIAEDDVVVAKEVVDCKIITNGKCILDGGTVLSSEIYAKKGLKAGAVGSEAASPSKLVVGIDQIAKMKVAAFKTEISENSEKIKVLEKEIPKLNESSDRLNTELGKIAQVQDKHMVNRRKLLELQEKEKREPTAKEQVAIRDFDQKIEEIDRVVEELMAQDEQAQAQVVACREEISKLEERINALNEEIKEVELFATRDLGIPSVQISGKLYQNTRIEGPHDTLSVQKTLNNATIKEQKNAEAEAEKPYSFKLSHR